MPTPAHMSDGAEIEAEAPIGEKTAGLYPADAVVWSGCQGHCAAAPPVAQ
jgi:hypothetical protein